MSNTGSPTTSPGPQVVRNVTLKSPFTRKTDVFDSDDFEPIKFINQIYPDEASLGDLDKFVDMLKKQIRAVDKEIFQAVRQQSGTQARSRQDLSVATGQIGELFTRIHDIQRKASDTEVLVQEICRDIRKLDYAKRHLTLTITSLRRLAMLTAAVDDLEQVGYRRDQYKRSANLLEAVSQLLEYFSQYENLSKIQSLKRRLAVVQSGLQEAVMDDFKMLLGTSDAKPTPENVERLASACQVVNALGPKVRDQLMDWLCDREMTVYQTIFSMSGDAAKLDRFERRFTWFKGRLEDRKEVWAVFPQSWRVPQILCLTFCKITKAALKKLLSDSEAMVKADVAPLIKTVVATNKFEKEMAALFGGGTLDDEEDGVQDIDNLPASEARRRLEAYRKRQQAAAAAKAAVEAGGEAAEAAAAARVAFEGAISEAFEPALKHYVAEEQKELLTCLEGLINEEQERKWMPPEDAGTQVLGSANQLFLKIRSSLTRCVKLVSKGPTLLGLVGAFSKVLVAYANELLKRLPKTAMGSTTAAPPYHGSDWHVKMPEEEEAVVCNILHTAGYCRETIEGLAAAVAKDIKPELADQVDLADEESAFSNVCSQCLGVLVLGLNTRLDGCLQDMLRMRWDTFDSPGDDSPYVSAARRVLTEAAPRLGAALDKSQFGFFCDKMARMFVPRYIDTIYKLRKISEKGTLQLSIDTDSMRRTLLEFPRLARPLDEEGDTAQYAHYVEREMGAATNLVKVLQAKPENLVDTFILLMPTGAKTAQDLARICELQGFTKKLQSELLALYMRKMGQGDPLAATPSVSGSAMGGAANSPRASTGISGSTGGMASSSSSSGAFGANPGVISGMGGMGSSNLNVLRMSVNTFTKELASSMNLGLPRHAVDSNSPHPPSRDKPALQGLLKPGGLNFNMQQTAARTREGFAKMAGILPGKLGGGSSSGDGAAGGGYGR